MAMRKLKESLVKTVDDDKELGESDVSEISDAVPKITAKYRQFGIGLGVLPGKIDEIEKQRKTPSSVRDKLSEVITVRLGQLPAPTWKTFIDAAKPMNRALAERVEKNVSADTSLDTKTVTEKFEDISSKYYQFGINLKIKPGELDGIKNETSIHDLMQGVILEFLRSPREKYKPTWRTIVDAVFDIHPALAKEIAEQHLLAKTTAKPTPSTTPLEMEEVSGSQAPLDQPPNLPTAGTKRKIVSDCDSTESNGNSDNGDHSQHPKRQKLNSVPASKIIGVGSAKLGGPVQIAEQWKLLPLHEKGLNGQGVTIIILDSFIDSNFGPISMKGQTQNIPSGDFIMVTEDMNEDKAHGTYCATIAAGAPHGDFRGGVAPAASLVCCRVSPDGKDFYEQGIVNALDHMLNQDVGAGYIISMSFGCEKLHDDITKRINELTERKVVCVAAAGNDGPPKLVNFPASLGNVISVGSCNSTGQPSGFNNIGNIDVLAPGENLVFDQLKGTSFAAPAIAGIIALLMQQAKNIGDPKMFANICDVNVIRNILTYDLKARGVVGLLAPHELLEDGPEKLKQVIEKYTCT